MHLPSDHLKNASLTVVETFSIHSRIFLMHLYKLLTLFMYYKCIHWLLLQKCSLWCIKYLSTFFIFHSSFLLLQISFFIVSSKFEMDPKRVKIPDLLKYIPVKIKALKGRNTKQWTIKHSSNSKKEEFLN